VRRHHRVEVEPLDPLLFNFDHDTQPAKSLSTRPNRDAWKGAAGIAPLSASHSYPAHKLFSAPLVQERSIDDPGTSSRRRSPRSENWLQR
jgi:hypothetical protein